MAKNEPIIRDMYWSKLGKRYVEPDIGGERARSRDFYGPVRCRITLDERGNQVIEALETKAETNDDLSAGIDEEVEGQPDGDPNPDLTFGAG